MQPIGINGRKCRGGAQHHRVIRDISPSRALGNMEKWAVEGQRFLVPYGMG